MSSTIAWAITNEFQASLSQNKQQQNHKLANKYDCGDILKGNSHTQATYKERRTLKQNRTLKVSSQSLLL